MAQLPADLRPHPGGAARLPRLRTRHTDNRGGTAAEAAPSEIKADFTLVADALGPFLELFVSANGDYMALYQDPEFQAKAERVGQDDVVKASERVNAWFTEHCS